MDDLISFVALGGIDELGKHMLALKFNDDIFVINAGIEKPDKNKPGIDYIIPRFDYLLENKDKVRAYILTQSNDPFISALPYFYKKVPAPIYCTDVTRIFLLSWCVHNHLDGNMFDFRIVEPTSEVTIASRRVRFFQTCNNMARSFGVCISSTRGNVVCLGDFVIDNNGDDHYLFDSKTLGSIANETTLLLMLESRYAEHSGYTNPLYKLGPRIERILSDAEGRVFVAISAQDIYNIENTIKLAIKANRKIIAYDEETKDLINRLINQCHFSFPTTAFADVTEVNRMKADNVLVLMVGFGSRIYHKIGLLAMEGNEEKFLYLTPSDTFIVGLSFRNEYEVVSAETLDDLYHTDCHIVSFNKKEFKRMHASEEDIKTILSTLKPKYYIPINGSYKQLLSNAMLAVNMNIGLNHLNVFVIDNGMMIDIDSKGARISPNKVMVGDLFVDGKGIGDVQSDVLDERVKFSDDGVIILGATVSISKREIVAGPDIQTRGLVFVKEQESLLKEINRVFVYNINQELTKVKFSNVAASMAIQEAVLKTVRRYILKSPTIIPIIAEIE